MRRFRLRAGLMAALLTFGGVGAGVGDVAGPAAAPSPSPVTPSVVEQSLDPGQSLTVTKTVRTPAVPPKPDVVLLVDNTGSMEEPIADVRGNLPAIVKSVFDEQPDSRFAVASYGDQDDPGRLFLLHQEFTNDRAAIQSGVDELGAGGGGDTPEDWGNALWQVATGVGGRNPFRSGASPVVVLVGDASSHDPSGGHSFDSIVATLKANNVKVLAVDVESYSDGLDGQRGDFKKGQATRVAGETGGTYLQGVNPNEVADAITSGLSNLPVNVTHEPVNCDPSLSVSLTPAARQVTSGQTATFTETVTVAQNAPQGSTLTCTVQFYLGPAGADPAYQQHIRISVNDVTAPVVSVEDRTVEATGPGGAVVEYPASAVDAVDGPVPVTCEPPSGSRFPIGETTVTCTATDGRGNTGRATAVIKVVDTTAPVVTVDDRTVEATGPGGTVIEYPASAVDSVDGSVPVTCVPPSGSRFPVGETTVTCTATDSRGNTGRDTAVFTVVDTTAPVVTVEDRTVEATGPDGAVVEFPASAVDSVDGSVPVTCVPPSGSRFPVGETTVTCTATDEQGNTGRATAVIKVVDTTAPVVRVDDRTVQATSPDGAVIDYGATAVDGIDGPVSVVCVPLSGSAFPVGKTTVTCTATDSAGNVGTDTAVFTVVDGGAPVVRVDDRIVEITGGTGGVIRYTADATDVIDGTVPVTCTPPSGSRFPIGRTTVTCTAKDKAGNTGRDTAVFTVVLRPPTPRAPAADVAVTAAATPLPGFTGGVITTTFTLTNAGPDTATGVALAVDVPQPVRVLTAQSGCTNVAPCTLRAGDRIEVTARISYERATTGTLTARVRGATRDPRTANNTDTLRIRVLQPVLTAGPLVARLGDVVLAEGRDFPAGTVVKLEWSEGITARTLPVRVGADGTFRTQMLVLRKDETGPRLLRAEGPGYNPLETGILVVPRSLQPPKFAGRG
ncbi:HYR domain-containing protein [Streptomyces sp. GMY02]|uniref:HYR domain-containing protein n=1 Tax=Streptomyces sp. GMY02 TaxID=1333528 RepID=UPI001C2C570F|nr:HYR domain-containing protein [Streptomyces sp. GMY02]QXE33812.1 HYR domain-containing protein [Streptomyces sp. GMY02]